MKIKALIIFLLWISIVSSSFAVTVTAIYGQKADREIYNDFGVYVTKINAFCVNKKIDFKIKKPDISWVGFILENNGKEKWIEGVMTEVDFNVELKNFSSSNRQGKNKYL